MEQDMVIKNNSGDISIAGGIEGRFLEMLASYVGFKYQLVIPPDGEWGVEMPNGSWTGIIGMVNKGVTDLGLGYLVMTEERYKAVKFSTPYNIADKTFITNPPKKLTMSTTFIHPFSLEIWFSCLLALFAFPIILKRMTNKCTPYTDIWFRILATFFKQPIKSFQETTQMKLIFGFWSVFITLITLSYSGVLPSFLAVPLKEKNINTIRDLVKVIENRNFKCLAPKGSSEVDALFHSKSSLIKRIGKYIKGNKWYYDLTNGTLADKLQENTALIGLRLWFSSPDFFGKILSSESFGVWNVGIALKEHFCCKRRLNLIISRIQSAGLFDKLISDEFFKKKLQMLRLAEKEGNKIDDRIHELTLDDMHDSFIMLISGHCFALFCFLCEITLKFFYQWSIINIVSNYRLHTLGQNI